MKVSSFCTDGGCVGVTITDSQILVHDTKTLDGHVLRFTPAEWAGFVAGVKADEFDHPHIQVRRGHGCEWAARLGPLGQDRVVCGTAEQVQAAVADYVQTHP